MHGSRRTNKKKVIFYLVPSFALRGNSRTNIFCPTYSLHSHSVLEGLPANETCMFFSVFGAESREEVWQLQKRNEDGGEHSMFRVGRGSA